MNDHIGGDALTIAEAIDRLGNQAPALPTFIQAVRRMKILKTDANDQSFNAKTMISWKSTLEYIENGGFKQCGKNKSPADTVAEAPPLPPKAQPGANEVKPAEPVKNKQPRNHSLRKSARHESAPNQAKPAGERKAPQPRKRDGGKRDRRSGAPEEKGRRNASLRVIKNNLRHLTFEETKAIRDWADNRLLTVLRPSPAPISTP